MNAGKAVYGILSANSGVTDIVSTRIFPEIAEQEAATPFIVYQLQSVDPDDTHDGPSKLDEVRFEFICYADSYNQAADLGEKVRGALDRVSGTYNGVNVESVQFNDVDVNIEYDPRRYSQVLTFTFRIKRDDITIALGTPVTGAVLGDLSDVDVSGVRDGQVIAYNDSTENWEAANAGGGASTLDDLTDTQVSGASPGTILSWNGSYWVPIAQSTSPSTTDALTEGTTNLYYTEARVSANTDVAANTAKVGITTDQANAITANTAKTSFPGFGTTAGTALEGDTALLQLGTTSSTALAGDTTTISTAQANAITANTAKTSFPGFGTTAGTALEGNTTTITTDQASAITANTAKTSFPGFGTTAGTALEGDTALLQIGTTAGTALEGDTTTITTDQANAITANTAKNSYPTADATKLAGIEEGAEVNVNADWTAASGDAQILNKPTLATVATSGSYTDLSNTPTVTNFPRNHALWRGNTSSQLSWPSSAGFASWSGIAARLDVDYDSASAVNASKEYVVPETGLYECNGFFTIVGQANNTVKIILPVFVDGTRTMDMARTTKSVFNNQFDGVGGTGVLQLTAGEKVTFNLYLSPVSGSLPDWYPNSGGLHFAIRMIDS